MAGKLLKSHRIAWAVVNHKEPAELFVLHACDNPSCCNPKHLFLGTGADNSRDMVNKGRHDPGDQKGEVNGNAKLTECDVKEIRRLYASGKFTYKELAAKFDIHFATVGYIIQEKLWPHL